jgi:DNA-binding NarL/FixJ family response regulator
VSISVFLADDHTVVRNGLQLLLESQHDIQVVGEAGNGREAVWRVGELEPDIVIMDIAMPELNGIEATRMIRESCPSTRVIILSMLSTQEHIFRALQAGADGYLIKDAAGVELVAAVRAVHGGRRFLSEAISDKVVDDYVRRGSGQSQEDPLERLSPREREVMQLIVEGHTTAEIAEIVSLSPKTVETYRSRVMAKLEVKNLPELVKLAIAHGLIILDR